MSWRGWVLLLLVTVFAGSETLLNAHAFLAVTHRVETKSLVIEGWIQQYAIRKAADELKSGSYERIFTTGGPDIGNGGYTNDYQTAASVGAEALKKLGTPADSIQMVPSHVIGRDRTYSSAVALRNWLRDHNTSLNSMNVLTQDAHARRTRLLYEKAFGKNVTIGIISVPDPDYDAIHWWRYSDGVREVIGESIAYIYARFFFYPSASSEGEQKQGENSQP